MNTEKWIPDEGVGKKLNRHKSCKVNTPFSKNRANHRNEILKTWALRLEPHIKNKIPDQYRYPFNSKKCLYCLSDKIGFSFDEFRPISQRGRMNIINCVPCCGACNSSKQDKCGLKLITWINNRVGINEIHKKNIIDWYRENEQYMIIPDDTIDNKSCLTYRELVSNLDERLNKVYEDFS